MAIENVLAEYATRSGRGRNDCDIAIDRGFHSLVEVLLQGGAAFETEGFNCPIRPALQMRRPDLVKLLVEHGADPRSVDMGDVFDLWDQEIIEYFIEKGADFETGRPLARALSNRIRPALKIFTQYKDRFR